MLTARSSAVPTYQPKKQGKNRPDCGTSRNGKNSPDEEEGALISADRQWFANRVECHAPAVQH